MNWAPLRGGTFFSVTAKILGKKNTRERDKMAQRLRQRIKTIDAKIATMMGRLTTVRQTGMNRVGKVYEKLLKDAWAEREKAIKDLVAVQQQAHRSSRGTTSAKKSKMGSPGRRSSSPRRQSSRSASSQRQSSRRMSLSRDMKAGKTRVNSPGTVAKRAKVRSASPRRRPSSSSPKRRPSSASSRRRPVQRRTLLKSRRKVQSKRPTIRSPQKSRPGTFSSARKRSAEQELLRSLGALRVS